jgi:hypothetical protein
MKRNFLKYLALGLILLTFIAVGACAEAEVTTPPPTPAEFEVTSLDITPSEATTGETVSITAVVENIGGSEGTYAATLTVDGATVETKQVTLSAGASETVTFSLMKDTPGTYQVGIGGLTSSLTVEPKLVAKEVELKYDDGRADSFQAIGRSPGNGYLIDFTPPAIPFTITKVKIYGNLYGTGYESLEFTVEIWDKEQETIYSASYPHTMFSLSEGWVEIDIPEVAVSNTFYIHVFTQTPREGGINVGYDSSVENEHSDMTLNWEIEWWGGGDKELVNWMIRVVGTYMAPEN